MPAPLWHIAICFVPLLAVEIFLFKRHKKDFMPLVQAAVLLGLLALIPATLLQTLAFKLPVFARSAQDSLLLLLVYTLVINGFIEETAKSLCLFTIPLNKTNYTKFLCLALVAGLSFGCFETVIYLLNGNKSLVLRLFTSEIIHSACSVCCAVTVYGLKTKTDKNISWWLRAFLLHGCYNFFYTIGSGFKICAFVCLATAAFYAYKAFLPKDE